MSLKTVGTLTQAQLDKLLESFPKSAEIKRHKDITTARAPNGEKVLSAARLRGDGNRIRWHVMAAPGLVEKKAA